jgi:adenosine/AMP kinase
MMRTLVSTGGRTRPRSSGSRISSRPSRICTKRWTGNDGKLLDLAKKNGMESKVIEAESDITARKQMLRKFGYKL